MKVGEPAAGMALLLLENDVRRVASILGNMSRKKYGLKRKNDHHSCKALGEIATKVWNEAM